MIANCKSEKQKKHILKLAEKRKGMILPKDWRDKIKKSLTGKKMPDSVKIKIRESNKGRINLNEKNGHYHLSIVQMEALHQWIKRRKQKPEFCERCHKSPPYDLANISGEYKRDINDFEWLCRSCHTKIDYKNGIRRRN